MNATQLTLTPVAPMTCGRCGGTSFASFAGPSGKRQRCTKCAQAALYAICRCGHGMQAHMAAGGCQAATDGPACECDARCPR